MTQISEDQLGQARRRLCRRTAAALICGMADNDISIDEIDKALSKDKMYAKQKIDDLTDGLSCKIGDIAQMAFAIGVELNWSISKIPDTDETTE